MADLTHHFCLFYRDNRLDGGWIEGTQKNKYIIHPLHGKTQFLPENRLLYHWRPQPTPATLEAARPQLEPILENAHARKTEHDLETMHQLAEAGTELAFDEVTELFLEDPEDPSACLSLQLALLEDERWFKRARDGRFIPRTEEELAQLDVRLERERLQQEKEARIRDWIASLQQGTWDPEAWTEGQLQWLQQLEDLLAAGRDSLHWKELAPLMGLGGTLGFGEEQQLKRWLQQAGKPMSWSRLYLLRANVRERFPSAVLTEADALVTQPLPEVDPLWQDLPTYTIDAAKTQDYDDALTLLEWGSNTLRLAVHITDLSQALAPDSALFREAELRASSVYTLEEVVPMLPEALSNGRFSLKAGEPRPVLSYFFRISRDGSWQLEKVEPQVIRVQENLSYEEVDAFIESEESFWAQLSQFCDALLQKRIEDGALDLPRREFEFDLSDPQQIRIRALERNSPSNRLIQELAVLVNRETGRLFEESELPGIYRTQAPYELVQEVKEGETLTLEHISIEGARLSTLPGPHAGLACHPYMQASSPIRRFTDLISQVQLRPHLEGQEAPFGTEDMMRWAEACELLQKQYARAEREVTYHWKTCYLAQHTGSVFTARVRRPLPNQRLELELLELDYVFVTSGLPAHEKGEQMLLRVEQVDVDQHRIAVQPCVEPADPHQLMS